MAIVLKAAALMRVLVEMSIALVGSRDAEKLEGEGEVDVGRCRRNGSSSRLT